MSKFQKNSWPWQFQQTQQRITEWIQAKLDFALPQQSWPAWLLPIVTYLLWFLLMVGLAWIGYQLLDRYKQRQGRRRLLDRPAALPVKIYTVTELLAQAQQCQSQHNYSEACRCLYLAMLQRLNDAQLIPHQASRTDREYAELLRHLSVVSESAVLLNTHEQLQFADRAISAVAWENCQQAYVQLDAQLQQQADRAS